MTTRKPIIFYDIPSTIPGSAFSPNTWKARYCLNYKNVPYQTIWVEYPDIAPLCEKLGVPPTTTKPDGSPYYTLPVIHDPETGRSVSESLNIAVYLDEQFPDPAKRVVPEGTLALQWAFVSAYLATLDHLWKFAIPRSLEVLNPASEPYFRSTREAHFGAKMEDVVPKGEESVKEWKALEKEFGVVDGWFKKQETYGGQGQYLTGEKPCYADFVVGGFVLWIRLLWGEDGEEWRRVKSWHGGRWARLLDSLKPYENTN